MRISRLRITFDSLSSWKRSYGNAHSIFTTFLSFTQKTYPFQRKDNDFFGTEGGNDGLRRSRVRARHYTRRACSQWPPCSPVDRPSRLDPGCSSHVSSAPASLTITKLGSPRIHRHASAQNVYPKILRAQQARLLTLGLALVGVPVRDTHGRFSWISFDYTSPTRAYLEGDEMIKRDLENCIGKLCQILFDDYYKWHCGIHLLCWHEGIHLYKHRPSYEDRLPEQWYFNIEYKFKNQEEERGEEEKIEVEDEIGSAIIAAINRPASIKKSPKKSLMLTCNGGPHGGVVEEPAVEQSDSEDEEGATPVGLKLVIR